MSSVKARGIELWDFVPLKGLENLEEWIVEMKAAFKMSGWPKDYFLIDNINKILSGRSDAGGDPWARDPEFEFLGPKIKGEERKVEKRQIDDDLRHFGFKKLRAMVTTELRKALLNFVYGDVEAGWRMAVQYYRKEETLDVCTMLSEFFAQEVKNNEPFRMFADNLKQRQLKINALGIEKMQVTDEMYVSILMVRALKHDKGYGSVIEVIKDKDKLNPQLVLDKLISTAQRIESLDADEKVQKVYVPTNETDNDKNPNYKKRICFYYKKGKCKKGDNCNYKHEQNEEEVNETSNKNNKSKKKEDVKCGFCGMKNHEEKDCFRKKEKAKQVKEEIMRETQNFTTTEEERGCSVTEHNQHTNESECDDEDVWQVSRSRFM